MADLENIDNVAPADSLEVGADKINLIRARVDGLYTILSDITAAEATQLEAIGATTISAAQWAYVGAANQSLITTASPTFNGLTLTSLSVSSSLTMGGILTLGGAVAGGDYAWTNVGDMTFHNGSILASGSTASNTLILKANDTTCITLTTGTTDKVEIVALNVLTAINDIDIGAHNLRAATLTADGLTPGRLVRAGTAGLLGDATITESSGALGGITTLSMNNQLTNSLADGTAPLVITSTTKVSNLNVERVDGAHASSTPTASYIVIADASGFLHTPSSAPDANYEVANKKYVDDSTAATVTVVDESADTECFVGYFTAASGSLAVKTGTNLTFNSNTGILTGTGFAGNVTGDCSGSSGSCTGQAATVATITGLAPDTATTQATQASITSCANLATIGTVTSGTLSTGAVLADVTMTLGSDADGDIYYRASNKLTRLAKGTGLHVLRMNSGATAPEWAAATGGVDTALSNLASVAINESLISDTDDTDDLGSAAKEWKDLYIDGTANIDSLVADTADINGGTVDGATIGGGSAAALTCTTFTSTGIDDNASSTAITIDSASGVYINDTENAEMTIGLTINQGDNDDDIFALKSSDVAHGITDYGETDSFFILRKKHPDTGGVAFKGFGESEDGFLLQAFYITDNTTKTTAGKAPVATWSAKKSGTGIASVGADANVFVVRCYRGASPATVSVFIVDEDGHLFADDGVATTNMVTKYDNYEDAHLVRALDIARSRIAKQEIKGEFDKFLKYNENTLVELGILGARLKDGGLTCITRLQQLHNGAIWQNYTAIQEVKQIVNQAFGKISQRLGIPKMELLALGKKGI